MSIFVIMGPACFREINQVLVEKLQISLQNNT